MEVSRLGKVEPCHAGWPHCDFIHPTKLLDGSADSAEDGKQLHMAIAYPCLAPTATQPNDMSSIAALGQYIEHYPPQWLNYCSISHSYS